MFKRIDHVAIHVSNLKKSTEFYTSNFGFVRYFTNETPKGMNIEYLKLGDTILELAECDEGRVDGFHFCLEAKEFDNAINSLREKRIKMESEPHYTAARKPEEEGWRRVVFFGPDDEQIEIRG